jgi:5-methylcytosine-specific restriction endonuclease McrA
MDRCYRCQKAAPLPGQRRCAVCAELNRETVREWYRLNKDRKNATTRARRALDPEARRLSSRKLRANFRENHPSLCPRCLKADVVSGTRRCEPCTLLNRDTVRKWAKTHPDAKKAISASRRARKRGAPQRGPSYTGAQFKARCAKYGGRCWYCGRSGTVLQADHFIPLAGHHGSNTIKNIVPACPTCNARKGSKSPLEFLARSDIEFSLVDEIVLALMKLQALQQKAA